MREQGVGRGIVRVEGAGSGRKVSAWDDKGMWGEVVV